MKKKLILGLVLTTMIVTTLMGCASENSDIITNSLVMASTNDNNTIPVKTNIKTEALVKTFVQTAKSNSDIITISGHANTISPDDEYSTMETTTDK